ncbi:helix-turn-helix domain-containing protein [Curtobacterium sp. MCSS17_008]|uniref:helix-turn-helix domain-containing protein n=1 Tax=Curtobacterium sp. MCSS17_008 TaxID=2175647 RepID=UPI0015E892BB|nr:helix-turn-helix domain-containing protein [Curtobacterium sp. MCSS17_008]
MAATVQCSRRTAERRFRESRGRTPDEFRRWYRSLRVRRALLEGEDEREVARRFGFATVGSLRRALDRARPPRAADPHDPLTP